MLCKQFPPFRQNKRSACRPICRESIHKQKSILNSRICRKCRIPTVRCLPVDTAVPVWGKAASATGVMVGMLELECIQYNYIIVWSFIVLYRIRFSCNILYHLKIMFMFFNSRVVFHSGLATICFILVVYFYSMLCSILYCCVCEGIQYIVFMFYFPTICIYVCYLLFK